MKKPSIYKITFTQLPEEVLDFCADELSNDEWFYISFRQKLSEHFIDKHRRKLYLRAVAEYQFFSPSLAVKMGLQNYIGYIEENKVMTKEQKQEVIDTLNIISALSQ